MTLYVVFLYVAFVLTLVCIAWLTARMRQHEDLLLDLRFRCNEILEKLATKKPAGTHREEPSLYTADQVRYLIDQLGKETTDGHDR